MKAKLGFILGATMMLTACDRHPDTVIVQPDTQAQQAYMQPQQPVYVQQPSTVVVERDNSGDIMTGVATGMLMHHVLSHSYGGSSYYTPSHTTVVHNNTYVNHTTNNVGNVNTPTTTARSMSRNYSPRSYSSRNVSVSSSYRAKSVHVSPFARH